MSAWFTGVLFVGSQGVMVMGCFGFMQKLLRELQGLGARVFPEPKPAQVLIGLTLPPPSFVSSIF